ncbi:hypothetical protein, partial [Pseudomonas sp. CES]|uniref:hypothetical protein n=1 Tax=Pseudomonas sp. CES TaxID=2719586 RepID=UPI001C49B8D4
MSALGDGDCPLPTLSVGDTPEGLLSAVLGMTAKSSRELFILFRNISVMYPIHEPYLPPDGVAIYR